jgi:thiosulfate/3-mercaptopyruvate sulfurtransferase
MTDLPDLIAVDELAARLDDPAVLVFDATVRLDRRPEGGPYGVVSMRDAYAREHIPGAAFADLVVALSDPDAPFPFALPSAERFAREAGALGIGPARHVVVYAQAEPMWATRLWWLLRFFGFDDVSVLDGGLNAWRAAGRPLEAGERRHPPTQFEARPRPELLATTADVQRVSSDGGACLINALAPAVFRGEGPSSYARPGRIPGSVNVPWAGLVDPDSGRFRPVDELRAALDVGEQPIIAYCGGGISATVDLFALHLVGEDEARLYDGSLTEWSADPTLPLDVG